MSDNGIVCPACKDELLSWKERPLPREASSVDRVMMCSGCGHETTMRKLLEQIKEPVVLSVPWRPMGEAPWDTEVLLTGPSGYSTKSRRFVINGYRLKDWHAGRWNDMTGTPLEDNGWEPDGWLHVGEVAALDAETKKGLGLAPDAFIDEILQLIADDVTEWYDTYVVDYTPVPNETKIDPRPKRRESLRSLVLGMKHDVELMLQSIRENKIATWDALAVYHDGDKILYKGQMITVRLTSDQSGQVLDTKKLDELVEVAKKRL